MFRGKVSQLRNCWMEPVMGLKCTGNCPHQDHLLGTPGFLRTQEVANGWPFLSVPSWAAVSLPSILWNTSMADTVTRTHRIFRASPESIPRYSRYPHNHGYCLLALVPWIKRNSFLLFCSPSALTILTIRIFYSHSTVMCFPFSRNTGSNFAKTSRLSFNFD